MALVRVRFKNGNEGVVGEEWVARWPEDIDEVLGADDGSPLSADRTKKKSGAKPRASAARSTSIKPAPEVPGNSNTDKKEI